MFRLLVEETWMALNPQKESILNQLAQRRRDLEDSFQRSFLLDELEARRLARDLKAESSKNAILPIVRAAMLHELAYVEALRGRLNPALEFMERASHFGLGELSIAGSKAHILIMFGQFLKARELLEMIPFDEIPADAASSFHGLYEEVGMYSAASKLRVGNHAYGALSDEAHKVLNEANVSEIEITKRLDCAAAVVNATTKHRLIAYDLFAMSGEGILFRFVVDGPISELVELDWEITSKVAESFNGPADEVLSIGVKPFSPGEKHLEYGAYNVHI